MSVFRRLRSDCEVDAVYTNPPRTRPLGTVTSLSAAPRPKQHFRWRQCRESSSKSKLTRREGGKITIIAQNSSFKKYKVNLLVKLHHDHEVIFRSIESGRLYVATLS